MAVSDAAVQSEGLRRSPQRSVPEAKTLLPLTTGQPGLIMGLLPQKAGGL